MRFQDALEGFWLDRRRMLSANTVRDYSVTFRRFAAFAHNPEVAKVTARQVNQFLAYLADDLELAPKTVQNAWIALSSFWTWAEGVEGLGAKHIMRQVERPAAKSLPMAPFTEDEVRRMLGAVRFMDAYDRHHDVHVEGKRPTAARDTAILLTMLDTGIRVSELCDLQVLHLDRYTGRLVVQRGKGGKGRTLFLGTAAQRAVWRWLASRGDALPADWLFGSSRGGKMRRESVRLMIVRTGDRAGVTGATPHRFRHTFAINFLRNGGNIAALQQLLGHSTLTMSLRYARIAEVDIETAQRKASPADWWGL